MIAPSKAVVIHEVAGQRSEVVLVGFFHAAERRPMLERVRAVLAQHGIQVADDLGWYPAAAPFGLVALALAYDVELALAGNLAGVQWRAGVGHVVGAIPDIGSLF